MRRALARAALVAAVAVFAACGFQHTSSITGPSGPGTPGAPATPSSGAAVSLLGMWQSQDRVQALPSSNTCGNFQYQISSQTENSVSGTFSAICGGGLAVTSSASGQIHSTEVTIALVGNASVPGFPSCSFSVTGNGTIEDNGNTLRLPYSGTTCLGPVSGTELLHRPQAQPP